MIINYLIINFLQNCVNSKLQLKVIYNYFHYD